MLRRRLISTEMGGARDVPSTTDQYLQSRAELGALSIRYLLAVRSHGLLRDEQQKPRASWMIGSDEPVRSSRRHSLFPSFPAIRGRVV